MNFLLYFLWLLLTVLAGKVMRSVVSAVHPFPLYLLSQLTFNLDLVHVYAQCS